MILEEVRNLIQSIQKKIEEKFNEIKQLEQDYEELVALKQGLNNVLERYSESCSRDRTAMDDPILESNRAMQMFRASMLDALDSGKTSVHANNVATSISDVGARIRKTLESISGKESEIEGLRLELSSREEEAALLAAEGVEGV